MRKPKLYFLSIFTFFIFISVEECFPQVKLLEEDKTIQILIDELVTLNTGVLDINITTVNYELTGDALHFISQNIGNRELGYSYYFKAIKSGEIKITLSLQNMKKGEEGIIKKYYKVKVFNDSEITKVNVLDIYSNPKFYTDNLFILDGISRGWGKPVNASIVWGTQVTRSDWVFEDSSGALYITGVFMIEAGKEVKIIGNTVINENNDWTFYGYKIIPK